ncbi:ParB N-terminal domain-containing protein [Candidatus Gottesmanbacteria bacterium]|nr:ParB N-terminal domain-containing protein [Candidatus Gottesmanbacteria bacterium]
MHQKIQLVDIQKLVAHERTDRARIVEVRAQIRRRGAVRRPVIVDRKSKVILDGHHRVRALQEMGARRVPVMYVRYQDARIKVYLRRKEILMDMLKDYVIRRARSHMLFPSKTTRHFIGKGRSVLFIRVADLMT